MRMCLIVFNFVISVAYTSRILSINLRQSIDHATVLWVQRGAENLLYVSTVSGPITQKTYPSQRPAPPRFEQFINLASGSNLAVSEGLKSCTDTVQVAGAFKLDKHPIVLIDTPGFDDTARSDTDVLTMIAAFLETSYVELRLVSKNTETASSHTQCAPHTDTGEVPCSLVSSTSTGSPILEWAGYQGGTSTCSGDCVGTKLSET